MNRRRMMMSGKNPLAIFKQGESSLLSGTFHSGSWSGKPFFSGGILTVASKSNGDGTYSKGGGAIYGIDFSGYRKIKYRVNVPNMASYVGGGGFEIGIGAGPFGGDSDYFLSDEWKEGVLFESEGDFEGEIDVSALKGEWPLNLIANGATSEGEYAILNIYELWLE